MSFSTHTHTHKTLAFDNTKKKGLIFTFVYGGLAKKNRSKGTEESNEMAKFKCDVSRV